MLEFLKPGNEFITKQQTTPATNKNRILGSFLDEFEWRERQNARAQKFLRELYAEREQLLAAAGVTQDNFAEKALEVLDTKGDRELARAILGKYVLSPEQEIRVFQPFRCLIPIEEPVEPRFDLDSMDMDSMLLPRELKEPE